LSLHARNPANSGRPTDRMWDVRELTFSPPTPTWARVRASFHPGAPGQLALKHLDVFLFQLWINRITAASQEHGLKYPAFIVNLIKCQVELNRKVLADLAIYEPKTFKSLAALAKRRRQEGFAAALGDGKEPEGVFSRVVQDC
uniref:Large ribosomal subunit protein bL20m n=1 Tax=Panthera tigris altaica TaxID=74533 RepID=A0A8C9KX75_PANTA